LRAVLPINVMTEPLVLDKTTIPDELRDYIYLATQGSVNGYLPLMDLDDLRIRTKDLVEVNFITTFLKSCFIDQKGHGKVKLDCQLFADLMGPFALIC
jgi:hypothetical protein